MGALPGVVIDASSSARIEGGSAGTARDRAAATSSDVRQIETTDGSLRHESVRACSTGCRVAGGSYPPPAPTEPDLWASHPALRDGGVGRIESAYSDADLAARSHSLASVSCTGATTRCFLRSRC